MDNSWVLKREALQLAKQCIATLQLQLGVRLKLANPDFLGLLGDFVDLLEDKDFERDVVELYNFAGLEPIFTVDAKADKTDLVEYLGRSYPRFKDSKEFKSLYRGQPVYA